MKHLFLTSTVDNVATDLVKYCDLSKGNTLACIDTAAEVEEGDKQWLLDDRQALVNVGFAVSDYTITDKTTEQLRSDLSSFSFIYVSGGNTMYLLQQAQKSGFVDVVRELILERDKTYISTSAGSIIAGPDIYPAYRLENVEFAPDLKDYTGFNLVNFCILPHWGSDHFKDLYLDRRLEHAYTTEQVPIVLLTDNQYVHVQDDRMEIIDIRKKDQ